jgi:hypothetical protein
MITFIEFLPYLKTVGYILIYLYVFWTCFLACAALYAQWKVLPTFVKVLAAPIALVGGILDVFWNYTFGSLIFGQLPPSGCYTFTERLSAYLHISGESKRKAIANVICIYLLNPFQVGGHCK